MTLFFGEEARVKREFDREGWEGWEERKPCHRHSKAKSH
jgi:hypothetical protein